MKQLAKILECIGCLYQKEVQAFARVARQTSESEYPDFLTRSHNLNTNKIAVESEENLKFVKSKIHAFNSAIPTLEFSFLQVFFTFLSSKLKV